MLIRIVDIDAPFRTLWDCRIITVPESSSSENYPFIQRRTIDQGTTKNGGLCFEVTSTLDYWFSANAIFHALQSRRSAQRALTRPVLSLSIDPDRSLTRNHSDHAAFCSATITSPRRRVIGTDDPPLGNDRDRGRGNRSAIDVVDRGHKLADGSLRV
jgi:hypothetical protein